MKKISWCTEGLGAAGCCAKLVCGMACCLGCIGPIILIVGIVLIVIPNDRVDNIKAYNRAAADYDGTPLRALVGGGSGGAEGANSTFPSSSTIHGRDLTVETAQVNVLGDVDGVDINVFSTFLQAFGTFNSDSEIKFNIRDTDAFSRFINKVSDKRVTMACSSVNGCSSSAMQSRCNDRGAGAGTYYGSGCSGESASCGTCVYPAYLETYCVVISPKLLLSGAADAGGASGEAATTTPTTTTQPQQRPNAYAEDPSLKSCYYPFGQHNQFYNSPTNVQQVAFNVRLATDPFIVLQRLTEGTADFGVTAEAQLIAGGVLVGFGAVVCAVLACLGYWVYKMVEGAHATRTAHQTMLRHRQLLQQQQQQHQQQMMMAGQGGAVVNGIPMAAAVAIPQSVGGVGGGGNQYMVQSFSVDNDAVDDGGNVGHYYTAAPSPQPYQQQQQQHQRQQQEHGGGPHQVEMENYSPKNNADGGV